MEQGLWTAIFTTGGPITGGGIVYLSNGKLVGGDSQFYWVGRYSFNSVTRDLNAEATVLPFVEGAISIFGIQIPRYELRLQGKLGDTDANLLGFLPAYPQLRLNLKLVKRLDGKV